MHTRVTVSNCNITIDADFDICSCRSFLMHCVQCERGSHWDLRPQDRAATCVAWRSRADRNVRSAPGRLTGDVWLGSGPGNESLAMSASCTYPAQGLPGSDALVRC